MAAKKIIMLSDAEIAEIKELRAGFNVIPEADIYDYKASRRVEVSGRGALFFLKASIVLNLLVITIFFFTFAIFMLKPAPLFYATHPSGSVYGPLPKYK